MPPPLAATGQQVEAHATAGELRRLLHGLGYAAERVLADHDAVDDNLDGVLVLLIELDLTLELADLPIHTHAAEALLLEVLEELGVLALATEHDGGEHVGAPPLPRCEDLVGHLVGGLARDGPPALRAVRHPDAGEEQAQVVVDLRDGTHRGARVSRRGLLVDGDGRGEAVDGVEVGLVHLAQEHAGVAGERLHIAALPLGVDGVEGETGLAGAREARDHD